MKRTKLKYGGKCRPKALFGEMAVAGATLAAAGINAAATTAAARQQASAIKVNAQTQAQSIKDQTTNNNQLQEQSIEFIRQQNEENREQQQNIQMMLQRIAGEQNLAERQEANKMAVKYGGRPKRNKLSYLSYRGGNSPFTVTDGGGAIPIQIDPNGYGLYELYGNDHEHYHKTKGGKHKTGVGVQFKDGSVVEGEGNQNTNKGELLYVTPDDAIFISKHSIDGFNPRAAVANGMHPEEAFAYQEYIKDINGYNDDGSKAKCGTRKSIKRTYGGFNPLLTYANISQLPLNSTPSTATGTAYTITPIISPLEKDNIKRLGGRVKAKNGIPNKFWNDYGSSIISAVGNIDGTAIIGIGNNKAAGILGDAYGEAADIIASEYSKMHGIDPSSIRMEDYTAPHSLAIARAANTNINPQLERIRRNAQAESREVNRNTLSSAARQNRLTGINDRMLQRSAEQYAYKYNTDEQIRNRYAQSLTQVAQANADRDAQARRNYTDANLQVLQYNNSIENNKIAGIANARVNSLMGAAGARATANQATAQSIGNVVNNIGTSFANAHAAARADQTNYTNTWSGLGNEQQVRSAIARAEQTGDLSLVRTVYARSKVAGSEYNPTVAKQIEEWAVTNNIKL